MVDTLVAVVGVAVEAGAVVAEFVFVALVDLEVAALERFGVEAPSSAELVVATFAEAEVIAAFAEAEQAAS